MLVSKGGEKMNEIKKRTQLAFDIDPEVKVAVKVSASLNKISMNLWIERAIKEQLNKEKVYRAIEFTK